LKAEPAIGSAFSHSTEFAWKNEMKATIFSLLLASLLSLPLGWFIAMALTPVLWRLEPVLHMELAGHSGPSDWVFFMIWAVLAAGMFLVFRKSFSQAPDSDSAKHEN
jgi:hypothetical protein